MPDFELSVSEALSAGDMDQSNTSEATKTTKSEQQVSFLTPTKVEKAFKQGKSRIRAQSSAGIQCEIVRENPLSTAARELDRLRSQKHSLLKQLRRINREIDSHMQTINIYLQDDANLSDTN